MASFHSFFVTLLLVSSSYVAGNCPEGSAIYGQLNECIYSVDYVTNYTIAKQVCQNVGGQIVKIRDIFENVLSGTVAETQIAPDALSYIGVIKGSNGTWVYDDGAPLVYTNWKSGHPLADSDCAVISSENDQWISVGCASLHTFICVMPEYSCPRDWVTYNGSCYYFYNLQFTPNLIVNFTQAAAQSSCESMQSNLVSIHSDDEFNFLKNQISTASLTTADCNNYQALIGFTCASDAYKWLDGSLVDYNLSQSCGGSYGIINDPRCTQTSYWTNWIINANYARYICKKNLTKMTIDLRSVLKKFMIRL